MALNDFLSEIANAIREKKGTTAPIKATNFASEILSIQGGGGSSDLIDVTALPTTVDDSKIYRIAKLPDVYVNDGTSVISLRKQIEAEGASVNVYIVDILPVVGEPAVYGSTVNLYFQESDNTPYLYMDGTWLDIATAIGESAPYNGVVTSPSQATSIGLYFDYESDLAQTIGVPNSSGDKLIYQYTDKWEELVKKLLSQTKTVTPDKGGQNIVPDEGYELSQVVVNPIPDEYIIPRGSRTFTENDTYDVTNLKTVTVNVYQQYEKQLEIIQRTIQVLSKEDCTNVSEIGAYAFAECSSLTSVEIPDSVTSIGGYAFKNCTNLTSAEIPNSLTSIGSEAFYNCERLTNIKIPDSVTYIGYGVFECCERLTNIKIPSSVRYIYQSTFYGCSSLTSIVIPDSVIDIGFNAFCYCSSLESVVLGKSLRVLEQNAFANTAITELIIPDSVITIGIGAFSSCASLTSVVIGNSVTLIRERAFDGCNSLTDINYNGTKAQWNAISKGNYWNRDTGNYTVHCTDGDIVKS